MLGATADAIAAIGLDPQTAVGKNLGDLIGAEDALSLAETLAAVARDPSRPVPVSLRIATAASSEGTLSCLASPFLLPPATRAVLLREAGTAQQAADKRLQRLTHDLPVAFYESHETAAGVETLTFLSAKIFDLLGVPEDAPVDGWNALFANVDPGDLSELRSRRRDVRRRPYRIETTLRIHHPENGLLWVNLAAVPSVQPDGSIRWHGHFADVTEQMTAESRLSEAVRDLYTAHERMNRLADNSPGALFEYREDAEGNVTYPYFSARFPTLMGVRPEIIDADPAALLDHIHSEDLAEIIEKMAVSRDTLSLHMARFRVDHPKDGERWLRVNAMPFPQQDGSIVWYSNLLDVTADARREEDLRRAHQEAEEMRAENERQALHDGLTGLPNRRYYDRVLADRLSAAGTGGARDCILVRLDLDHFKNVNDTLGHEAGDAVLVRVAEVLRQTLRADDFMARIGGDEFSILMAPGLALDDARVLVADIQDKLAEPLIYGGRQCRFGASFGLASTNDLAAMGEDIQLFADAALYRAKDGGRNRQEIFTPELHREILHDRRLAVEIHEALDGDQFVPFFQPQVAADDGRLVGVETLLRWNHPTAGLLAPDAFMDVAEQLRVVADIDRLMMEKSRDALARWRKEGLVVPKISFNVSSGRMHDPDVVALASDMATGDTRVTFELLESILVEEESDAFKFHLDRLRAAGIDIEIDDFGSGHASIIAVMEIGPSALKIDKRIVLPVEEDLRARNLVRAIVEIAETLGIQTVAEGVETETQARILRGIGCGVLQGYLFARPLDERAFLTFALGRERQTA
ncbi:diguanylate cyclase/phosphodiesterase (GGDEF & EAL domains) with PAS/PAC sensor(s) [Rhodovulum sp. P5]|nr:diguanylate cyclase/phosphodiesterase (GGDEF & EAL domains) with PAS/PAC sensor(s) [Rhodovulum sp. P5]